MSTSIGLTKCSSKPAARVRCAVAVEAVSGQRDQPDVQAPRQRAQARGNFISVHHRQSEIQHGHIGRILSRHLQRCDPIVRDADAIAERAQRLGENRAGVDVVVDKEEACTTGSRHLCVARTRRRCERGRAGRDRQPDSAHGPAAAPLAFERDAAAVRVDEVADDGQAEAEPALRSTAVLPLLGERMEHARQHHRVDAHAVVTHRNPRIRLAPLRHQVDRAFQVRIFRGVRQHVREHLREPARVAVDHEIVGHGHGQAMLAAPR